MSDSRGILIFGALVVGAPLWGFEQGTYFVVDLVEGADAHPVAGRIAVNAETLHAGMEGEAVTGDRSGSKFFIGLGEAESSKRTSAFEIPTVGLGDNESESKGSTDSFGLGGESDSGSAFSFD